MDGKAFLSCLLFVFFWSCVQMITEFLFFTFGTIDYGSTKKYAQDLLSKYTVLKHTSEGSLPKLEKEPRAVFFPETK